MTSTTDELLQAGGGKVLRKRKVAKTTKKPRCPKPKKCPPTPKKAVASGTSAWKRTAAKAMYAGEMRSVWVNKVDGERAVRRVKTAPNGTKKYLYRRI